MDKEYTLRLKEIRKAKKLTQGDLASMIGATERIVGCCEREDTALSLADAVECARVLGCTPNDLCGWDEDPAESPSSPPLDPHERALLDCYEVLNGDGRSNLLATARGLSGLPEFCAGEQRDPLPAQGAA